MDLGELLVHLDTWFGTTATISSMDIATKLNIDHQKAVGLVKSLLAAGDYITTTDRSESTLELLPEGVDMARDGSHEFVFWTNLGVDGMSQADAMKLPNAKIGMGKALVAKWVKKDKSGLIQRLVTDAPIDTIQVYCQKVQSGAALEAKELADLKKRKLIKETKQTVFDCVKAPGFTTTLEKPETDLSRALLDSGDWATKTFKSYNWNAEGAPVQRGFLHPLLKVRSAYRQIFLEMGFEEMPTNNFVESSFWNFDSLFQPQQHPARDAHDTFFLDDPKSAVNDPPLEYLERVRKVHQFGGYGSKGYGYEWSKEEAMKNVLRTHTTAVSAKMLYKLAQLKEFKPTKYFSIDRVFRNETLDATHLAEFHQVEGLIADYDVSLSDLVGVLNAFFQKLGIKKLKFKPAFNPYTEPSMEIFSWHEGLKKWVEIGNSGMFRPEMLQPMGLPDNVSVIAWGLSLERPAMIKYGLDNIRDLCGHKFDLNMGRQNPVCRIDFERQRKACPIKDKFGADAFNSNSLRQLDAFLLDKSYLADHQPTQLDAECYRLLRKVDYHNCDNVTRYMKHLATFVNEFEFLPNATAEL